MPRYQVTASIFNYDAVLIVEANSVDDAEQKVKEHLLVIAELSSNAVSDIHDFDNISLDENGICVFDQQMD